MLIFKTKKKLLRGSVIVTILCFAALVVWAGSLEPPGPPGSTMRTLDEIYDLLLSIFQQQEAEVSGEGLAAEPRFIGCMDVNDGSYSSEDPNDLADPICGDALVYDPPWTRVIAGTQGVEQLYEVSSGFPTGLRYAPLVVTKNINRGSVLLFQDLVQGVNITDVTIHWYRDDGMGTHEHYATVVLNGAKVVDFRQQQIPTGSGGFLHVEDVSFLYQLITWTFEFGSATHTAAP